LRKYCNKVTTLSEGQNRIEKKLDAVVYQTADLTEFRTSTKDSLGAISKDMKDLKDKFDKVEKVTMQNTYDVAYLKQAK
jgi:hypothetical protein